MFDFAWSEIALIGVVALVAIGPKDLPVAIKTIAAFVKKARRMAAEFQTHVDELVREADLHEVRDQISQLRNFDIKREIEKAVDADGSIRSTLNSNPLADPPVMMPHTPTETTSSETPAVTAEATPGEHGGDASETRVMERPAHTVVAEAPPAFVPPAPEPVLVTPVSDEPPPFIPPGTHR